MTDRKHNAGMAIAFYEGGEIYSSAIRIGDSIAPLGPDVLEIARVRLISHTGRTLSKLRDPEAHALIGQQVPLDADLESFHDLVLRTAPVPEDQFPEFIIVDNLGDDVDLIDRLYACIHQQGWRA